jgi:flagellin-like protein
MYARKAMSPLIATVLLIAFAVALGAMIMNWSSDDVLPKDPDQPSTSTPCAQVAIELGEAFGSPLFCFEEGVVKFNVVNTGQKEIDGMQLRTIDTDLKLAELDVDESGIAIGGTFLGQIPVTIEGKVHAELVPYVIEGGKRQYCIKQKIVHDSLPACPE